LASYRKSSVLSLKNFKIRPDREAPGKGLWTDKLSSRPRPGFSIRPLASLKNNAYYVAWVQARAATAGNIVFRDPAVARARGLKLKRRITVDAEH
jgi:hypothetical protein